MSFNVHTDIQTYDDLFPKKYNCVSQAHFILGIITSVLFLLRETKLSDFSSHVQIFISLELYFEGYFLPSLKHVAVKMCGVVVSHSCGTYCMFVS